MKLINIDINTYFHAIPFVEVSIKLTVELPVKLYGPGPLGTTWTRNKSLALE